MVSYSYSTPPAPTAPHSTPQIASSTKAALKPPIYNPYDKFTQPEFDDWIGGLTGALRRALGHHDLEHDDPISKRQGSPSDATRAALSDASEDFGFIEDDQEDEGDVAEDSFAEVKARRAKGKARDPREGPGLGGRTQPIELGSDSGEGGDEGCQQYERDESHGEVDMYYGSDLGSEASDEVEEVSFSRDSRGVSPGEPIELSSDEEDHEVHQAGLQTAVYAHEADEQDEYEEEADVDVIRTSSLDPNDRYLASMAKLGYAMSQPLPALHHRSETKEDENGAEANEIFDVDEEQEDIEFPPSATPIQPLEIPNPWQGPETYAEDFYSGGDVIIDSRGMSPSHLTPMRDNVDTDIGMLLTPSEGTPQTPPRKELPAAINVSIVEDEKDEDMDLPASSPVQSSPLEEIYPSLADGVAEQEVVQRGIEEDLYADLELGGNQEVAAVDNHVEDDYICLQSTPPPPALLQTADTALAPPGEHIASNGHVNWNWPPAFPVGKFASAAGHLMSPPDNEIFAVEGDTVSDAEEIGGPVPLGTSDLDIGVGGMDDNGDESDVVEVVDDGEVIGQSKEGEVEILHNLQDDVSPAIAQESFQEPLFDVEAHSIDFNSADFSSFADAGEPSYPTHTATSTVEQSRDFFQPGTEGLTDFSDRPVPSLESVQVSQDELSQILASICDNTEPLASAPEIAEPVVSAPEATEVQVHSPERNDESMATVVDYISECDLQPPSTSRQEPRGRNDEYIVEEVESGDEIPLPEDEANGDTVSVSGETPADVVPTTVEEVMTEGRLTEEPDETRQASVGFTFEVISEVAKPSSSQAPKPSLPMDAPDSLREQMLSEPHIDDSSLVDTTKEYTESSSIEPKDQDLKLILPAKGVPMPISADPTIRDPTSLSATPMSPRSLAATPPRLHSAPGTPAILLGEPSSPGAPTPLSVSMPASVLKALQGQRALSHSSTSGLFTPQDEGNSAPASIRSSEAGDVPAEDAQTTDAEAKSSSATVLVDVVPTQLNHPMDSDDVLGSRATSLESPVVVTESVILSVAQQPDPEPSAPSEIATTPTDTTGHSKTGDTFSEGPASLTEQTSSSDVQEDGGLPQQDLHRDYIPLGDATDAIAVINKENGLQSNVEYVGLGANFSSEVPTQIVNDDTILGVHSGSENDFNDLDLSYPPQSGQSADGSIEGHFSPILADDVNLDVDADGEVDPDHVSAEDEHLGAQSKVHAEQEVDPFKLMGNKSTIAPSAVEEETESTDYRDRDVPTADARLSGDESKHSSTEENFPAETNDAPTLDPHIPAGEPSASSSHKAEANSEVTSEKIDEDDQKDKVESVVPDEPQRLKRKRRSSAGVTSRLTRSMSAKEGKGKRRETLADDDSERASYASSLVDVASENGSSSSGASVASRMLRTKSQTASRASSVVSNVTSNDSSLMSQLSPTTSRPVPPPFHTHSVFHHHHHRPPPPPVLQLHRHPIPSSTATKEIPPESTSSQPSPSQRTAPNTNSPVTRSNCRFHKISLPREEDGPRVFFVVPGCSLGDRSLMEDEEIQDHGDVTPEDQQQLIDDIESLDFSSYLIGILRQLVGVDLLREHEVFYLPQQGEKYRRKGSRKSVIEKPALAKISSRDLTAHDSRSATGSPRLSKLSPMSSFSRGPVSAVSAVSTSASSGSRWMGSQQDATSIFSRSEDELTDTEEVVDGPKAKRPKKGSTDDNGQIEPSVTDSNAQVQSQVASPAKPGRTRRGKRLGTDAAAYKPNAETDVDSPEEERSTAKSRRRKTAKKGLKRSRTSGKGGEGADGDEGTEAPKAKKPRIRPSGRIDDDVV